MEEALTYQAVQDATRLRRQATRWRTHAIKAESKAEQERGDSIADFLERRADRIERDG